MKLKGKITAVVLGVAMAVSVLAGCGSGTADDTKQTGQAQQKENKEEAGGLRTVSIQIDGAAVPYYAPLYMAQEKGYFKEEGLNVEFYYAAAADIVTNVASGNVDFGFPNADAVVAAKSKGIPVKVAHTTYQEGLGAIIFGADSGIKEPADLKGKTVAVTSLGSANYFQLQAALESAGLTVDDVKVEVIGTGAILNSLTEGQVDAIVFSKLRTIELNNAGYEAEEILCDQFLPSFGNVVITSEELSNKEPEVIEGFTKALTKGIEYVIDGHAEEAVDFSIENHAQTFDTAKRDVAVQILNEVFIPTLWQSEYTKEKGIGASDPEKWQALIDDSVKYGIIDEGFQAEELLYTPGK
ncbi:MULTISPECIES: ABC transporter substrate-binding protein [Lachnospiraceae]|jgi:NitT/TauT family transport system substrate-binding protein|uniref:ABC transporter substrate-binding protein n=1 Tax=Faecalicatena acetigenes TaxID=2981790 RepID=A0ABT2TDB8_9FIRM|nr:MULTISPECIES: ABC transporter substrate-binding protein [Lachnospiraceae]MCU6747981.1 ABC transporter substrate-binding protein [Faecalicatena acetigenes]RGT72736.1 ABC transporter substrate-binding protein [Ruminococcus sp. AF18-22]SCI19424.1 Putative thiamine biosynthesis protein HI_0357 [uncultured Clostridium sp.]